MIDLWVAASEAASEVWLFFLYACRKAGTAIPDLANWNGFYVRESRSEPAEVLGLAIFTMLGNAGFGQRRVKFCKPCFVRYVIKIGK